MHSGALETWHGDARLGLSNNFSQRQAKCHANVQAMWVFYSPKQAKTKHFNISIKKHCVPS